MKTNLKVAIIISSFAIFYFGQIPLLEMCHGAYSDCTVLREIKVFTTPVVPSSFVGAESIEWNGTVDDIEPPTPESLARENMPFVASMIIFPLAIIGLVLWWDKR